MADIKVVSQENVLYSFNVEHATLQALTIKEGDIERIYYLESQSKGNLLTNELLSKALEELLRVKPHEFDIVALCLLREDMDEVALKVYKKVMDEFYNMGIAEVAFERRAESIDQAVNATHTLFDEN